MLTEQIRTAEEALLSKIDREEGEHFLSFLYSALNEKDYLIAIKVIAGFIQPKS